MAASSLLEKIGDFLECQICLETFKHPKVLQCLHTFCQTCLDQMAPNGTETVVCPTCRGETVLPGEGVVDLKNNFVLANLLELVTSLQKPLVGEITTDGNFNTSFLCSNCDDEDAAHATSRCLNCCEFLCAECVAAHRRLKALRHHVMRDIHAWLSAGTGRDPSTAEQNGCDAVAVYTCSEHTNIEVSAYCEACDLLICDTCCRTEHSRSPHRLATFHEAAERQREEIKTILAECKRKLGVFSTAIECTVQIARDLQRRTDRAQKDLQNTSRERVRLIQEEQARLINELHKKKEDKESEMAAHIDSLQRAVDMIRNMCSLADNSLFNGSHVDILRAKTQLVNRRHQLDRVSIRNMPMDTSSLRFVPSSEPSLLENKLGHIED